MDGWVRLGELAVDSGRVCLTALPISAALRAASDELEVSLAADLRVTHSLPAVIVRAGGGDGIYPVEGRLIYDETGHPLLAEVRILFIPEPEQRPGALK